MSLKAKYDDVNNIKGNVVPLGHSEIKSILKSQSEAVFIEEKKMGPDKAVFIKKSLIDIALEFQDKADQIKVKEDLNNEDNADIVEPYIEDKVIENKVISEDDNNNDKSGADLSIKSNEIDDSNLPSNANIVENVSPIGAQLEEQENNVKNNIEVVTNNIEIEETKQALNSVRDAVSQSINNSIEMTNSNNDSGNQNDTKTSASNQITEDIENFKSIFSELKNMTESLVCETIENKIIEIAQELAGYQIDKMPEKYEKKIKSFLKNINCFDEKIAIETNDKDYEALSKIENFKNLNKDIKFIPNSEISRGDIILNCDGMYYSEKTINNNQSVKKK
ncbi:MAG: FliH/SctL family protein [Proteobacteria bacterium]|nr:FliH/SctL family protein [Pseudomonadota bacterium]MDA1135977.1 FliH/SctL family protein [Pseudomonadota bacterium]